MSKFPSVVYFRITSKCNHNCRYCYASPNINDLSLSDLKKIFHLFYNGGVKAVVLCGEEPLIREDIIKIFQELKKYNFKIFLDTNGDFFFKYKKHIEKYVDVLGLPLDFSTKNLTQNYRGKKNFENILNILIHYKKIKKKPFLLRVGTVITKDNVNDIENIAILLKTQNIDLWKIYEFIPSGGNAILNQDKLKIDIEEFNELIQNIKEKYSNNIKIIISQRKKRDRAYFLINPDGSVFIPVDNLANCKEIVFGNIFDKDIIEKWNKLVIEENYKKNILQTFNYKI